MAAHGFILSGGGLGGIGLAWSEVNVSTAQ